MNCSSFKQQLVAWLIKYRLLAIVFVCLLTVALFSPFVKNPHILFQQNEDGSRAEDSTGRQWLDMAKKFDQGEPLLLVIEAEKIFTPDVLRFIQDITESIKKLDGVNRVQSLTTIQEISVDEFGEMKMDPLLGVIPEDSDELTKKQSVVLSNPLWAGNLLSLDGKVSVVHVTLPPLARGSTQAVSLIATINQKASSLQPENITTHVTGISPLLHDSSTAIKNDFKRFLWLTWLIMVLLLFFAFRTLRGIILPLGITMLAVGWTLGLMAMMGETISSAGAMLPSMIAIVCFSDAIHVLAHYYEHARKNTNRVQVIISTMENMLTACFLTSITTAAAFLTLTTSKLSSISQLGFWSAFGIMLGYFLISLLMPVILSFMPLPDRDVQARYKESLFTRFIRWALRINSRHGSKVIACCCLLFALALIGLTQIRIETSMSAFLPENAPSMKGLSVAQENLLGFSSVELELQGPENCFEEPWALKEIKKIERFLEKRDDVGTVFAITDVLQWTYQKIEGSDANMLDEPHAKGLIAEILFLMRNSSRQNALSSLLTEDNSMARVSARLKVAATGEQVQLLDDLQDFLKKNIDPRLNVITTGDTARISNQITSVIRSLTDSFFITLGIIFCVMLWMLRSLKGAAISMIPNIFPVILTLGFMGILGLSLNFATAMISSIAIGIAVDNTIHMLVRYKRENRKDIEVGSALENTIWNVGRALMFTSVVMAAGCWLFTFSDFSPVRHFGALMVFTICMALVMDLFVLPWLIRFFRMRI